MTYIPQPKKVESTERQTMNFWDALSVPFTTTKEYVSSVLPPCFEPLDEPTGSVVVSQYRKASGAPHPGGGFEYDCAMIYLDAKYKDIQGVFALLMLVSGDMPVTLGREMLGEPKKNGSSRIYQHGSGAFAIGERSGRRLIEIDAQLGEDQGPDQPTVYGLELKGNPAPDFKTLLSDPYIVVTAQTSENVITRTGPATLRITDSPFDPVGEIPIVSTGEARYEAGLADFKAHLWEPVEVDADLTAFVLNRRMYDFANVESPSYE